jgi:osmoprotectant transport system substrate-binding protein
MTQKFFRICLAVIFLLVATTAVSQACVGRILYVGAIETVEGQTMAELLVLLINERTGTNVKIRYFDDNSKLYQAFKSHEEEIRVDIIIENTADAMALMQKDRIKDLDQEYLTVKKFYEKELDATWLKAFGFKNIKGSNNPSVSASLIRNDVLTNYPLLPRILNKLSGAIDEKTFSEMIGKVRSGSKAKNVVKDFLRAKKFI